MLNLNLASSKYIKKYFSAIDKNKYYSNFGPLYFMVKKKIMEYLSLNKSYEIILTSSGDSSLFACLLKIKSLTKKKYFLIPSFSFYADVNAVKLAGFEPVFIDINFEKMHSDISNIQNALKEIKDIRHNIAGCLVLSAFGKPIPINKLNEIVRKFKIHLIYDAANAFLNLNSDLNKSNFFTICSFHPSKSFGANESGLIITKKKYYKHLKSIINFGIYDISKKKRDIINFGFNGKFSEYDAGIFLANFKNIIKIKKNFLKLNKVFKNSEIFKLLSNKKEYETDFARNVFIFIFNKISDHIYFKKKFEKGKLNFKPWGKKLMHEYKLYSKFKKAKLVNSINLKKKMLAISIQHHNTTQQFKKKLDKCV